MRARYGSAMASPLGLQSGYGNAGRPQVRATRLNHVSIHAYDMEESLRFYTELFGMEPLPSPNFGDPVEWLRLGDQQLHLFKRETPAPEFHHIALDVDDFQAAYLAAKERRIGDRVTWAPDVR